MSSAKQKTRIDDHKFNQNMKSIIHRDLFPELKTGPDDETINQYSLSSYLQNFMSKDEGKFIDSVERDRRLKRSMAPWQKAIVDKELEAKQFIPWKNPRFNSLFYPPKEIENVSKQNALTYNRKKQPRINYDMVRIPENFSDPSLRDYPSYHPFTTESSTTESESEFEGRSFYRKQMLENVQYSSKQIHKDRLERIKKKKTELSSKGMSLLKSLEKND